MLLTVASQATTTTTTIFNFNNQTALAAMGAGIDQSFINKTDEWFDLSTSNVFTVDDVTLTPDAKSSLRNYDLDKNNSPKETYLICNQNGKLVFSSTKAGTKITNIELVYSYDDQDAAWMSCSTGNLSTQKTANNNYNEIVWSGSAESVTLTNNSDKYVRAIQIKVTIEEAEEVQTPVHIKTADEFIALSEGTQVVVDVPMTAVFQSTDGVWTYLTPDATKTANLLLHCTTGLAVELSRDDVIKAGAAGTKTTVDGLSVLEVDASTISRNVTTTITATNIEDDNLAPFAVNDFVKCLSANIVADQSSAPALRSVKRRAADASAETYTVNDKYQLVNKYGVRVLTGTGMKFLGIVGQENGTKVVYPTYVTLPTGTVQAPADPNVKVTATQGLITVTGTTDVLVINAQGQTISRNSTTTSCPPGPYVVITPGTATKLLVP